jgi:hypothetical protein
MDNRQFTSFRYAKEKKGPIPFAPSAPAVKSELRETLANENQKCRRPAGFFQCPRKVTQAA